MVINLPDNVRFIINRLKKSGFDAYIVGGCVRDSLMGKTPADWDITTDALPSDIARIFKDRNLVRIGERHGTIGVILSRKAYEVTTYRIDGAYSDGRRPDAVTFTASLHEDLARRDFTINAMAYNEETGLVDYFGGVSDLEKSVIRCVGEAHERFGEDYLRMLRAFRFAAVLGFELDSHILNVICEKADNIKGISAERIMTEVNKLLASGNDEIAEMFVAYFGNTLFEGISDESKDLGISVMKHTGKDISMRLAALLCAAKGEVAESATYAEKWLRNMKYDNDTIAAVKLMILEQATHFVLEEPALKRQLNRLGDRHIEMALNFRICRAKAESDLEAKALFEDCLTMIADILASGEAYRVTDLAINGKDIMDIGVPKGKAVGAALNALLETVIEDPTQNTRENLLERAKSFTN